MLTRCAAIYIPAKIPDLPGSNGVASMVERIEAELEARLATEIAVAYLANNTVERADLGSLIRDIRSALADRDGAVNVVAAVETSEAPVIPLTQQPEPPSAKGPTLVTVQPAVPVDQSITDEYLISLEDGKHYRSLRRHLMAKYGMTPEDYRRKWDLPHDYPMVAPSYARDRSEVAKRTGLGRSVVIAKSKNAGRH